MAYVGGFVFVLLFGFVWLSCSENICKHGSNVPKCSLQDKKEKSRIYDSCISENLTIVGPCCMNTDNVTIENIDLGFCGISSLTPYLEQLQNVVSMSIQNTNITCAEDNFLGLKKLYHLWLSEQCNGVCPGSNDAWYDASHTECVNQTNSCNHVTCVNNNTCEDNGPGLYHCICALGYHGYRCLREGYFPAWQFAAMIASPTVILSGALWYFTLRKTKSVSAS